MYSYNVMYVLSIGRPGAPPVESGCPPDNPLAISNFKLQVRNFPMQAIELKLDEKSECHYEIVQLQLSIDKLSC